MLRNPEEQLTPKQYVDHVTALHRMKMQSGALRFLYVSYGFMLGATMLIIFFQGFHVGGFNLDEAFLKWLGAVTLGEVGGLAVTVYGALFRKR